jgi:uncharacterized membrane protein
VLLFLFISVFNVTIGFSDDAYSACFLLYCFFLIQFLQSSGTVLCETQVDFTFQCGFCVLIGLFVALNPGEPRNPHQLFSRWIWFIIFITLGLLIFFILFRAVKQPSESLSITLFDCSKVLVMLMAMFIAVASALNIENGLCNSMISVGVTIDFNSKMVKSTVKP